MEKNKPGFFGFESGKLFREILCKEGHAFEFPIFKVSNAYLAENTAMLWGKKLYVREDTLKLLDEAPEETFDNLRILVCTMADVFWPKVEIPELDLTGFNSNEIFEHRFKHQIYYSRFSDFITHLPSIV
ncbi:hypothetical protein [Emticicia fontis]